MQKKIINGLNECLYYEKAFNGLKIYIWQNKNCHNVYASVSVNYGSSYYRYKCGNNIIENKTGIAHFLEHVSFNIGKKKEAFAEFNKLGTFSNAYTDNFCTCYYISYRDNEYKNLDILLKMVLKPYLSKEKIAKEKGIIVSEKRNALNNPYYNLYYKSMENLFYNNNIRSTTLGTVEDISNITVHELNEVHDAFYNPHNMQLVICGNVDPQKTMNNVLKILNKYPTKEYQKKEVYFPEEPHEVFKKEEEIFGNVKIPKVKLSYKFDRKDFPIKDTYVLGHILNLIIKTNFGATSEFKEKLVIEDQVQSFSVGYDFDCSNTNFYICFTFESDNPDYIIKKIKTKIKNITFTKEDFVAKMHSIKASFISNFENNEVIADIITNSVMWYGDFDYHILDKYTQIKYQDVLKMIKLLDFSNSSVVILKPQKK